MSVTNVMIVEDQKMIRGLLEIYVENTDNFKLVSSITNASRVVGVCEKTHVDIILMDVLTEENQSGLDASKEVKQRYPSIKIVVVTSLIDEAVLEKAKAVGADSLWYKDVSQEELMDVVERTMRGEHIFPDAPPKVEIGCSDSYEFTQKEKEVLRYLIKGIPYPEIAKKMGVGVPAIKYHVTNMLQKTGYKDKLTLALAVQNSKFIVDDF